MGVALIRTVIVYVVVTLSLRLMGKRQIGELEPSELIVAMMISELATVPIEAPHIPILKSIAPILCIAFLEVAITFIGLKSKKIRRWSAGKPTIVVYNGHIDKDQLEHLRMTRSDVMEQLRLCGCFNVLDVKYAIMEKDGRFSVKLKNAKEPVTEEEFMLEEDEPN